jgi:tetratricopeptide (TPR) repeat protein
MHGSLGDSRGAARVYTLLGDLASSTGDDDSARTLFEKSLALSREEGFASQIAWALWNLGDTALAQGDSGSARAYYEEGLGLFRQLDVRQGTVSALERLGRLAHRRGDDQAASILFEECVSLASELGDKKWSADGLEGLAAVAEARGQPQRAARLLGAAEAVRDRVDTLFHRVTRDEYDRRVTTIRAALGQAAFAVAWAQGGVMTLEQSVAYALER